MAMGEFVQRVRAWLVMVVRVTGWLVIPLRRAVRPRPTALRFAPHALDALSAETRSRVVTSIEELPRRSRGQVVIVVVAAPPPAPIDTRPIEQAITNGLQLFGDQVFALRASLVDAGVARPIARSVNEVEAIGALAEVSAAMRELRDTVREELVNASRLRREYRAGDVATFADDEDLVARRPCEELPEVMRVAHELEREQADRDAMKGGDDGDE